LSARSTQKAFEATLPTVGFRRDVSPSNPFLRRHQRAGMRRGRALLGCISAFLFSFADTDKDLASRCRTHFLCAFAIALGAAGGLFGQVP
jgi:hypothetical protein